MESARRPTSADVARMAGVSRATVSAVLNGRHGNIRVSDATRQRVLAMAATLAYVPHATAQALRRQQSGVLGFIPRAGRGSPIASPGPYHLSLAIARAAQEQGYHVLEASTEAPAGDIARTAGDFLIARHVDGIIVQTPDTAAEVEHLVQRRQDEARMGHEARLAKSSRVALQNPVRFHQDVGACPNMRCQRRRTALHHGVANPLTQGLGRFVCRVGDVGCAAADHGEPHGWFRRQVRRFRHVDSSARARSDMVVAVAQARSSAVR